jgi:NAD(P)-dependent dehydrogenase (short-subunit alcohol dehydrogenase family)
VDDFDLTGRVAIITGGNSGIGLGMADALARAGCAISIWGRARVCGQLCGAGFGRREATVRLRSISSSMLGVCGCRRGGR